MSLKLSIGKFLGDNFSQIFKKNSLNFVVINHHSNFVPRIVPIESRFGRRLTCTVVFVESMIVKSNEKDSSFAFVIGKVLSKVIIIRTALHFIEAKSEGQHGIKCT